MLATLAAARTAHAAGSLVAGYRLSFLVGAFMALAACALVALKVSSRGPGPRKDGLDRPAANTSEVNPTPTADMKS